METLDQNNQAGSGASPPDSWHGGIPKMGPDTARLREGAARDLFSFLLYSPTTLCRTLRCCGRKRKPDAWPSWPGRGECLRHCVGGRGKPQPTTQEAHTHPRVLYVC